MNTHHFIGDSIAPSPLASVRKRRAILGTGKLPQALHDMTKNRFIYAETDNDKEPSIQMSSIESAKRNIWKIGIPVGNELRGSLPGLTAEQHSAKKFLEEIKDTVSFQSHRPEWIDSLPVPRLKIDRASRAMRRFDGTRVNPLWVYDNARFAFEDSSWPWGLVGRLFNNEGESGTAALIGDRLV